MRRTIFVWMLCGLWGMPVAAVSPQASPTEVRSSFTIGGKPIPPRVFSDFGDDDLAVSSPSSWVTIDLMAAPTSNRRVRHSRQDGRRSQGVRSIALIVPIGTPLSPRTIAPARNLS